MNKPLKIILFSVLDIFVIIPAIVFTVFVIIVQTQYSDHIFMPQTVEPAEVIMVLGARIEEPGVPSKELQDRLDRGIELYNLEVAPKVLVTGDDGQNNSDEISTMQQYLIDHGVPEENVMADPHGYRTYESCKRAKEVFDIEDMILVTQQFHINRALYLCNELGIEADGVTSDIQEYNDHWYNIGRDLLASVKAYIDINFLPPTPPVAYVETSSSQ